MQFVGSACPSGVLPRKLWKDFHGVFVFGRMFFINRNSWWHFGMKWKSFSSITVLTTIFSPPLQQTASEQWWLFGRLSELFYAVVYRCCACTRWYTRDSCFRFTFSFFCLCLGLAFCVFIRFLLELYVFVVLDVVFSVLCQEIGLQELLRNDLFCVEWDVKALTEWII